MPTDNVKHLLFMSYNLEIMDLIFLFMILAVIAVTALGKIYKLRGRVEAIEKHLNISDSKKA